MLLKLDKVWIVGGEIVIETGGLVIEGKGAHLLSSFLNVVLYKFLGVLLQDIVNLIQ